MTGVTFFRGWTIDCFFIRSLTGVTFFREWTINGSLNWSSTGFFGGANLVAFIGLTPFGRWSLKGREQRKPARLRLVDDFFMPLQVQASLTFGHKKTVKSYGLTVFFVAGTGLEPMTFGL